jgi:hypothetical protein
MDNGYIFLHRKIREHWIWDNPDYLKRWIDILLMANHKPQKIVVGSTLKQINSGEFHTSQEKLSERWFICRKTVDKFLNLLISDSMITIEKSRQSGTTIKVCNYGAYQRFFDDAVHNGIHNEPHNGTDNERTSKEHEQEPKNIRNNILSSEQSSDGENSEKNEPVQPKRSKPVYEHDSRYYRAADWLAKNIEQSVDGYTPHSEKQKQAWADEMRKIIELDKKDIELTITLLVFARKHHFWHKNILSMGKFREQYDKLLAHYRSEKGADTG